MDLLRWKLLFYLGQGQGFSITIEKGNATIEVYCPSMTHALDKVFSLGLGTLGHLGNNSDISTDIMCL